MAPLPGADLMTGSVGFRLEPLPWPREQPPRLLLVVDTEEGFDWHAPLLPARHDVSPVMELPRLQELAEHHGIVPCYVVTWPLLADDRAARVLAELGAAGAVLGVHLHSWITPPFGPAEVEALGFQGRLPAELEEAKLARLVALFRERLGRPPRIHKAGRYGLGPWTARALRRTGLHLDLSPAPAFDYRHIGGPDYRRAPPGPARLVGADGSRLPALPASGGFVGPLRALGPRLFDERRRRARTARALGQRSRLVRRLRLSPEGHTVAEMRALARRLLARGAGCLTVTLHSPSLAPGWTPYVRDRAARGQLLTTLDHFLRWARACGLVPDVPSAVAGIVAGTPAAGAEGGGDGPAVGASGAT